jgi:hypothetical protein
MRSILRSEVFAGQQIESVVTDLVETTVPASAFEVPAGFTEVAAQIGLPALGGQR